MGDKTPDVPKLKCAEVAEAESLPMAERMQVYPAKVSDTEADHAEDALIRNGFIPSESDDEEIDAEVGDLSGGSEIQESFPGKAVRAQERAPAPCADVNIEAMTQKIPQFDGAVRCSCAADNAWGCAHHSVFSRSLLLAHHELSIKIAKGPPGLELPEACKASSLKRTCFAMRMLLH